MLERGRRVDMPVGSVTVRSEEDSCARVVFLLFLGSESDADIDDRTEKGVFPRSVTVRKPPSNRVKNPFPKILRSVAVEPRWERLKTVHQKTRLDRTTLRRTTYCAVKKTAPRMISIVGRKKRSGSHVVLLRGPARGRLRK